MSYAFLAFLYRLTSSGSHTMSYYGVGVLVLQFILFLGGQFHFMLESISCLHIGNYATNKGEHC